jgi:transposase InsO family protein/predicted RNA methylase
MEEAKTETPNVQYSVENSKSKRDFHTDPSCKRDAGYVCKPNRLIPTGTRKKPYTLAPLDHEAGRESDTGLGDASRVTRERISGEARVDIVEEDTHEQAVNRDLARHYKEELLLPWATMSVNGINFEELFKVENVKSLTKTDAFLKNIRLAAAGEEVGLKALHNLGVLTPNLKADLRNNKYTVENELVFYEKPTGEKVLCLPSSMVKDVMRYFHEHCFAQHQGRDALNDSLKQKFHWKGMYNDVAEFVASCELCQMTKSGRHRPTGPRQHYHATQSFEEIHIDLVGPLPVTQNENKYVLTIMDRFTHFVRAIPLKTKEANEVIEALLNNWIFLFGHPTKIVSDNGTEFVNFRLEELCQLWNIDHKRTSAYHPESNGQLERWHRFLKTKLSLHTIQVSKDVNKDGKPFYECDRWDKVLPSICASYNNTPLRALKNKVSPHELVFGEKLKLPVDSALQKLGVPKPYAIPSLEKTEWRKVLADRLTQLKSAATVFQQIYDTQRSKFENLNRKESPWSIGDRVWMYVGDQRVGEGAKFLPKYLGPYKITHYNNPVNVHLTSASSKRNLTDKNVHVGRLKRATQKFKVKKLEASDNPVAAKEWKALQKVMSRTTRVSLKKKHMHAETKEGLIQLKQDAEDDPRRWHRTNSELAKQLTGLQFDNELRICDLFAGCGELTTHLKLKPEGSIVAVERNKNRAEVGKALNRSVNWLILDVFTRKGFNELAKLEKFDLIVANPPFEEAPAALKLALFLLKYNRHARIIFLLPSDIFESSPRRTKKFQQLPFKITNEYAVGKWSYITAGTKKQTADSIFVFRREYGTIPPEKRFTRYSIPRLPENPIADDIPEEKESESNTESEYELESIVSDASSSAGEPHMSEFDDGDGYVDVMDVDSDAEPEPVLERRRCQSFRL